jgi:hypothetical protein
MTSAALPASGGGSPAVAGSASDEPIPVKATFSATGTYTADYLRPSYNGGSFFNAHGHVALTLKAEFQTQLIDDGHGKTLANVTGKLAKPAASFDYRAESGFAGGPQSDGNCGGELPLADNAPAPQLRAERSDEGVRLTLESLTATALNHAAYPASCNRENKEIQVPLDPDVWLAAPLNSVAPHAFSAQLVLPSYALAGGDFTAPVASSPIPAECLADIAPQLGATCTHAVTWAGSVTISVPHYCGKVAVGAGVDPKKLKCLDAKEKQEAAAAADRYDRLASFSKQSIEGLDCHTWNPETSHACNLQKIQVSVVETIAQHYRRIANDPPDSTYRVVEHVTVRAARQSQPKATQLRTALRAYAAQLRAAAVGLDRQSGALVAVNAQAAYRQSTAIRQAALQAYKLVPRIATLRRALVGQLAASGDRRARRLAAKLRSLEPISRLADGAALRILRALSAGR